VVAAWAVPAGRYRLSAQLVECERFRGVELAWLDPTWQGRTDADARPGWLSPEWSELVGSPSGTPTRSGSAATSRSKLLAVWRLAGGASRRRSDSGWSVHAATARSWERGRSWCWIISRRGAAPVRRDSGVALRSGLAGTPSALFCDSLELDPAGSGARPVDQFEERFGYRLEERTALARTHPHMRYEYRRLVNSTMQRAFFETFAQVCHGLGAISRCRRMALRPISWRRTPAPTCRSQRRCCSSRASRGSRRRRLRSSDGAG